MMGAKQKKTAVKQTFTFPAPLTNRNGEVMHISKTSATQIVEEISKLVKQNINLMDETGHIIASCDKSRIGSYHNGAYRIISENLDEYYIEEDDLSVGVKKGINLPLELDNYKDSQQGQSKIAKFENDVDAFLKRNNSRMHFRNASRQIIIIDDMKTEKLVKFAGELADYIYDKEGVELNIGIDGGDGDMHERYVQAHRAWNAAASEHEQIMCYENMSLELLMSNISVEIKLEYLKKIFKGDDYDEICDSIAMLKAYFNAQGSIQKAADELYIHKNTLQYRISKLKETTGLDVRKPTESPALYLAYSIAEELISENYDLSLLLRGTK